MKPVLSGAFSSMSRTCGAGPRGSIFMFWLERCLWFWAARGRRSGVIGGVDAHPAAAERPGWICSGEAAPQACEVSGPLRALEGSKHAYYLCSTLIWPYEKVGNTWS